MRDIYPYQQHTTPLGQLGIVLNQDEGDYQTLSASPSHLLTARVRSIMLGDYTHDLRCGCVVTLKYNVTL